MVATRATIPFGLLPYVLVRAAGVEPALLSELDFESSASTNSTTPAYQDSAIARTAAFANGGAAKDDGSAG